MGLRTVCALFVCILMLSRSFKLGSLLLSKSKHMNRPLVSTINVRGFHSTRHVEVIEQPTQHTKDYFAIDSHDKSIQHGNYGIIASQTEVDRVYIDACDLGTQTSVASKVGDTVWIRARVANVRAQGNSCFIVLRSGSFYTVQACHFKDKSDAEASKALIKFVGAIPLESIVDIQGTIAAADVKGCTQKNVEIHIRKLFVVSRAPVTLPFLLDDAARTEKEILETAASDRPLVGVSQVNLHFVLCMHCCCYYELLLRCVAARYYVCRTRYTHVNRRGFLDLK
jgi:hypothetical protein